MGEEREDSAVASMDSPHRMPRVAPILARSAASTMEEPPEAFPHVDSRVSVVMGAAAFTEVAVVTAAAVTGDSDLIS